jgi:hypothetical protein
MIEGPFPVGKVLLAGSVVWTAYEIAHLQPKYRKEVETSLRGSLEPRRIVYFRDARQQSKAMVGSFDKLNLAMRAQVLVK